MGNKLCIKKTDDFTIKNNKELSKQPEHFSMFQPHHFSLVKDSDNAIRKRNNSNNFDKPQNTQNDENLDMTLDKLLGESSHISKKNSQESLGTDITLDKLLGERLNIPNKNSQQLLAISSTALILSKTCHDIINNSIEIRTAKESVFSEMPSISRCQSKAFNILQNENNKERYSNLRSNETRASHSGPSKSLTCEICNKHFEHKPKLILHKESKCCQLKIFTCSVCTKVLASEKLLEMHRDVCPNKNSQQLLVSTPTALVFSKTSDHIINNSVEITTAKESVFSQIPLIPRTESKSFNILQNENYIERSANLIGNDTRASTSGPSDSLVCEICSKHFDCKSKLIHHKESKCCQLKIFTCSFCAKVLASEKLLETHKEVCALKIYSAKPPFKCRFCNRNFNSKLLLKIHEDFHEQWNPKLPQTCEVCQKVCSSKANLSNHMQRSHSEEKFECSYCSKIFNSKQKITQHIFSKHMDHYFKCNQCSLQFIDENYLKNHKLRQHTSELSASKICEICGKDFKTLKSLKDHSNIHSNENPCVCHVCGKCFRCPSNLFQHSRTHSEIRPFVCDLCGKSFRIKNHLRQHMSVHGMVNTSCKGKRKRRRESVDSDI